LKKITLLAGSFDHNLLLVGEQAHQTNRINRMAEKFQHFGKIDMKTWNNVFNKIAKNKKIQNSDKS